MKRDMVALLAFLLLGLCLPGVSPAGDEPVGLISRARGPVAYAPSGSSDKAPVQEFMQMYKGDVLTLGEAGECQVVFFKSGFQETWTGPVALRLSLDNSEVVSKDKGQSVTAMLPNEVTQAVGEAGIPLPRSKIERFGMTVVRGMDKQDGSSPALTEAAKAAIAKAEALYARMQQRTGPDDIMAELYLIGVMARNGAPDRAAAIAAKALEKRPDSAWLRDLAASLGQKP